MYKPEHFKAYEVVDPETYAKWGEISFRYMDDGLMRILEWLRKKAGPLTVNTWKWGGNKQWSGLRIPASPWYSTYSGHSWGKALDIRSEKYSADELRQMVVDNWDEIAEYSGVDGCRLEHGDVATTWMHLDVMHTEKGVYVFRP